MVLYLGFLTRAKKIEKIEKIGVVDHGYFLFLLILLCLDFEFQLFHD